MKGEKLLSNGSLWLFTPFFPLFFSYNGQQCRGKPCTYTGPREAQPLQTAFARIPVGSGLDSKCLRVKKLEGTGRTGRCISQRSSRVYLATRRTHIRGINAQLFSRIVNNNKGTFERKKRRTEKSCSSILASHGEGG